MILCNLRFWWYVVHTGQNNKKLLCIRFIFPDLRTSKRASEWIFSTRKWGTGILGWSAKLDLIGWFQNQVSNSTAYSTGNSIVNYWPIIGRTDILGNCQDGAFNTVAGVNNPQSQQLKNYWRCELHDIRWDDTPRVLVRNKPSSEIRPLRPGKMWGSNESCPWSWLDWILLWNRQPMCLM